MLENDGTHRIEVTTVSVDCVQNAITIGGTIVGLDGYVLVANGDDVVSVNGSGKFFVANGPVPRAIAT